MSIRHNTKELLASIRTLVVEKTQLQAALNSHQLALEQARLTIKVYEGAARQVGLGMLRSDAVGWGRQGMVRWG